MKVSYFETARYLAPHGLPAEWPVPPDAYDRAAGAQAYRGMIERLQFVNSSASTGSACPSTITRRTA